MTLLTPDEATDRLRQATRIVLDMEKTYGTAVEESADAEAFYRVELARHFSRYREAGKGVEESTTLARGDCAPHSRTRDVAAGMLKLAAERLENARDSRRSLWRLIEWSSARDRASAAAPAAPGNGGGAPANAQMMMDNAPADRWP